MNLMNLIGYKWVKYLGVVSLLTLSFWSSGLFLIRILSNYDTWSSSFGVTLVFLVSLPLTYAAVLFVKKPFSHSPAFGSSVVYGTLAGVLLAHGLLLGFAPYLYAFSPSPTLMATAWIIWFSGVTLVVARSTDKH